MMIVSNFLRHEVMMEWMILLFSIFQNFLASHKNKVYGSAKIVEVIAFLQGVTEREWKVIAFLDVKISLMIMKH